MTDAELHTAVAHARQAYRTTLAKKTEEERARREAADAERRQRIQHYLDQILNRTIRDEYTVTYYIRGVYA